MRILDSKGYHIHFYYKLDQLSLASSIREAMISELPELNGVGTLRKSEVGPHPQPMFEAWFDSEHLDRVLRWTMLHRQNLSVMIHPLSGSDLADHRDHSIWLGEVLPLKLHIFQESH